ncbi:MAG: hypothetical protein PSV46_26585 [Reyranella sp.]|nr:hypothetical protein [Reyranella sp.]
MWLKILVSALFLAGGSASAMEFTTSAGADGRRTVVARGPIVEGDAERFRVALQSADRDSFGHKTVVLDSPGGVVGEAFAMVAFMDRDQVATVVRPGASCASACAQIVFLAGRHRIVQDGGRLGLHSCRAAKDGTPSLYCNDLIAQHAVAHGTIYGPIMAFMQMTPAAQIKWLDSEDADCWGLTRWPPGIYRSAKDGELPPCLLKGPNSKVPVAGAKRNARD